MIFVIINIEIGGILKRLNVLLLVLFSFFSMPMLVKADFTYVKGTMIDSGWNVRKDPNVSASANLLKDPDNTANNIVLNAPETFEIIGEAANGYQQIYFQYRGYYYTAYLNPKALKKETYTVKTQTIDEMKALGFNDTYAKKLAILKTIHPNWQFKLYDTGLSWDAVIKGETEYVNRNLIDGRDTTLRSTADGAYSNGSWTSFGSGWYAASAQTIKYFMDPRNFLNDSHIFMFEKLSYMPETHTQAAVQSLLNSTFMKGDTFECVGSLKICPNQSDRRTVAYATAFMDAAKASNVSPIHLASRVALEQGGSSVLITGNGYNGNYAGYYNYFNVSASGNTDAEIIKSGLAYAEKQGWNSPYKSIVGGASFVGDKYIAAGQDTMYFQKFDVIKPDLYWHQYMQNVRAPYIESYTNYKTYYNSKLIDGSYTFSIPYYSGMPEATTLGAVGNEDATLKSLDITNCSLMPSFTANATEYTCNVVRSITSVNVNAIPTSSTSSVAGGGVINLVNDETNIALTVTAGNGSTKVYRIKITKVDVSALSPDDILSALKINNTGGYLFGYELGTEITAITNAITSSFPGVKVTSSVNKGKITTGTQITIENNNIIKTYTIVLYGDANGDGAIDILDLQVIQKHLLKVKKLSGAPEKAANIKKSGEIDILDLQRVQKHILKVKAITQ